MNQIDEICFQTKNIFDPIISNFTIIDTCKIFEESGKIKSCEAQDITNEIHNFDVKTGLIIGSIDEGDALGLFILVFDVKILIINKINFNQSLEKVQSQDDIFYFDEKCKIEIEKIKSNSHILIQNDFHPNDDIREKVQNQIIKCIIRKSQLRTICSILYPNLPKLENDVKYNDFVSIKLLGRSAYLCFNLKTQFLYILKKFEMDHDDLLFQHETEFYSQISNDFLLIAKCYGNIKNENAQFIITQYIDGLTLKDFIIKNSGKLNLYKKMSIILNIMITIEYIHLNGFIIRDLKYDNIIIINNYPFFIDFDQTVQFKTNDEINIENTRTADIGSPLFTAPEQYNFNKYSYQADIYSLGMIIHFVLTEKNY